MITFHFSDRTIEPHPKLVAALCQNAVAKVKFDSLSPSMQKEGVRYIANLKTEDTRTRIIERAIQYLLGKSTFIGRKMLE